MVSRGLKRVFPAWPLSVALLLIVWLAALLVCAQLWNRQIKWSAGASKLVPANLTTSSKWPTRFASHLFGQLSRFGNLKHFPTHCGSFENLDKQQRLHTCKKTNILIRLLSKCFRDKRRHKFPWCALICHTNGGKMNVPCTKVIDFKLSIQITSELDLCPWWDELYGI